jgi:DNA-binding NtrC family response regulator
MPQMDGLELLRRAKELNQNLKVIVVTGYASLETASDCIRAGASDFLKKPFSISQIRESVTRAMAS